MRWFAILLVMVLVIGCSPSELLKQVRKAPECVFAAYELKALAANNIVNKVSLNAEKSTDVVIAIENCGDASASVEVIITVQPLGIIAAGKAMALPDGAAHIFPEPFTLPMPKSITMEQNGALIQLAITTTIYVFQNGRLVRTNAL